MSVLNLNRSLGLMALVLGLFPLASVVASAQEGDQPVVTHNAVLRTSMGDIEIELYGLDAPNTVKNFVELAKKGFYNGLLFHRIVPNFVIQGGDPISKDSTMRDKWGTGGESIYGGDFADELNPNSPSGKRGYVEGTLAMANRGANTNTSQFFIVLKDRGSRGLQYKYTIFGRVTKGLDVIHKIENVEIDPNYPQQPKSPVSILEINSIEVKPTAR